MSIPFEFMVEEYSYGLERKICRFRNAFFKIIYFVQNACQLYQYIHVLYIVSIHHFITRMDSTIFPKQCINQKSKHEPGSNEQVSFKQT